MCRSTLTVGTTIPPLTVPSSWWLYLHVPSVWTRYRASLSSCIYLTNRISYSQDEPPFILYSMMGTDSRIRRFHLWPSRVWIRSDAIDFCCRFLLRRSQSRFRKLTRSSCFASDSYCSRVSVALYVLVHSRLLTIYLLLYCYGVCSYGRYFFEKHCMHLGP